MRRLAALALLAVAAGCGGGEQRPDTVAKTDTLVSVENVQDAFRIEGVPLERELRPNVNADLRLWPVHADVDQHVLALLSRFDESGSVTLNVWVFDSRQNAIDALARTPQVGRGAGHVRLHESNVVVDASTRNAKRARAALVALRNPAALAGRLPKPEENDR
jgi:hypothetical protein